MSSPVTLIFRNAGGTDISVAATPGTSVMEAAVMANVPGIEGECGGSLSCATCHVYAPAALAGAAEDDEDAMLDEAEAPRRPESRLCCQITVTPDLDGAIFTVPEVA